MIYREGYWRALVDFAGWIANHSMEMRANRIPIMEAEKLALLFAENVDLFMSLGSETPVNIVKDKVKSKTVYTFKKGTQG